MKVLRVRDDRLDERRHDCERIQRASINHGVQCSLSDALAAWEQNSEMMCAGWLGLPDTDEEIVSELSNFIEDEDQ